MMSKRVVVTGTNGTVAPVVAARLRSNGSEVVPWNRSRVPETDIAASTAFLDEIDPLKVFHIGMGPPEWAELMASWCCENGRRFVFTSTASVFSSNTPGPFSVNDTPDAADEYGRYKRTCEICIERANADALIVRLGWQIGDRAGSNNMFDYFERQSVDGRLGLSRCWFPACSFLEDTAETLVDLDDRDFKGLYHLDANPGLSILEIGRRLSLLHDGRWHVYEEEGPQFNSLLHDDRVPVAPITGRLPQG